MSVLLPFISGKGEEHVYSKRNEKRTAGCIFCERISGTEWICGQIAVELNEEILPKTEYVSTVLKDGDVMEIVSFMGGGSC